MELTHEEKEIMEWGSEAFKGAWLDLCDVFQRIHSGEKLSREDALIDPYFLPFDIDARIAYHALQKGGKTAILGDNGSMLTVITNTEGNQIIWSAIEMEEDGVYTEFYPLSGLLGHEWDKKGAKLLYEDNMQGAFDHFAEWIRSRPETAHIDLGILKVANVQFFGAFKRAWEESDDGAKLLLMGVKMADAVNEIMENGWIRFCPDINLKKILQALAPVLSTLSPVNTGLQSVLSKLPF